jgi:hypothetical protein
MTLDIRLPHNDRVTVQEIHVEERGKGGIEIKAQTIQDWMLQHSAPYDTEPYDDGEYEEVFFGQTFTPGQNEYVIRHKKRRNIFQGSSFRSVPSGIEDQRRRLGP